MAAGDPTETYLRNLNFFAVSVADVRACLTSFDKRATIFSGVNLQIRFEYTWLTLEILLDIITHPHYTLIGVHTYIDEYTTSLQSLYYAMVRQIQRLPCILTLKVDISSMIGPRFEHPRILQLFEDPALRGIMIHCAGGCIRYSVKYCETFSVKPTRSFNCCDREILVWEEEAFADCSFDIQTIELLDAEITKNEACVMLWSAADALAYCRPLGG